ncbi:hypothetical protein SAMN05880561_1051, partial [Rhizobium sp. RU33A]|uniref:hypothetical protein n=1 Tax=Rhizobium sp. RU33A TaxID=1907413 RepID=UPI000956B635
MTEDLAFQATEHLFDGRGADSSQDDVLMAQIVAGAGIPAGIETSGEVPRVRVIVPDAGNRVRLAANDSLENVKLDGDDLLLIQPDGWLLRISGAALNVPTFIIGDIEVPQEALLAALERSGFDIAAGPNEIYSVTPQPPSGSGASFEDSSGASIAGIGRQQVLDLLGDDQGADDFGTGNANNQEAGNLASVLAGADPTVSITGTNDTPEVSGAVTGAAIEDGASVSLLALANASDVDAGTSLAVVGLPAT